MGVNICENSCAREFFRTVQEQIAYKAVRKEACKELENHLEDKTEEYINSGMSEEMAVVQAVKEMGDPTAVGVKLNESYSLQKDYKLPGLILLAVLGGMISNWVYGYEIFYSFYFFIGMAILLVVTVYGYRFCAKHMKILTAAAIVYGGLWICYSIIQEILKVRYASGIEDILWRWNADYDNFLIGAVHKLFSLTPRFNGMFLAVPLCAVLLYRGRNKKVFGLAASGALILAVTAGTVMSPLMDYQLTAAVIVIISYLGLSFAAAAIGKDKKVLIPILVTFACFALPAIGKGNELKEITELFLTPEKQAVSPWEDGYNGVLIKELLGRSKLIGGIGLTEEEIWEYGMGDWYFENGTDDFYRPVIHEKNPEIEDILPQHYLNNYRIAYVIIKYGWAAGILFLAGLAGMIGLFFYTTFHIRNRLGFLMAFGSSMVLTMQIVFYVLGNFGHQFGRFPNLPFISEGTVSIAVNMTLAGLILSAYRYDRVVKEESLQIWKSGKEPEKISMV